MSRHLARVGAIALAMSLAAPVVAAPAAVEREGSCSGGPGHWNLRVRRESGDLFIRFNIVDVAAGQTWQVFISDNGSRIFSGTRVSSSTGKVRVTTTTRDRAGSDRIAASGVNTKTGTTCEGSLRY